MADVKLLSVNVARPREVTYQDRRGRDKTTMTAIFKQPVSGPVLLRTLNLDGDQQADLEGHGGIYRAVYAYDSENYEFWAKELGRTDFASAGQFGENFTTKGLADDVVAIGDKFQIGGAVVQVTQPRVPCFKLGILMGIEGFQKRFAESCRVGFYLRVLQEGEIVAGDMFEPVGEGSDRMTVRQMTHLLYFEPDNKKDAERALRIETLSPGWRQSFEERIAG